MANYTVAAGEVGAYAKALAAGTVDTVTFTATHLEYVEILSDGTSPVYVTTDGSTPTVAGATTFELPATGRSVRRIKVTTDGATVVKLISAGTPTYSVARPSS